MNRVAQLMRSAGIKGVSRRQKRETTKPATAFGLAPDLSDGFFSARGPTNVILGSPSRIDRKTETKL